LSFSLNSADGVKITLGSIFEVLNFFLSSTPSLERLKRKDPKSQSLTLFPSANCLGSSVIRFSITLMMSQIVSEDFSSTSFAISFCETFPVFTGLAYHFFLVGSKGFALCTSLNFIL
jgi:hypothetical protein